jgi:hypothetical protein
MASQPSPLPTPVNGVGGSTSRVQGLWNIFFSPADALVGGNKAWLLPLLATIVLVTLMSALILNLVGLEAITRAQLESNPSLAEQLGPERIVQLSREAGQSVARKVMSYAMPPVAVPVVMLIVSGVLLGIYMMSGSATTFSTVFTATAWSWYAVSLVSTILTAVVLFSAPDYEGLDFQNLVALNPTMFIERDSVSKPVYSLLSSLDLLTFYGMALLALGVSKLSRGITFGKSAGVVIAGWIIWVIAKAGFSTLF